MDSDPEYIPQLEDAGFEINDDEEVLIDLVAAPDLSLGAVIKSSEKSDVWKSFGILQRGGRILQKVKDKIYCKICFLDKVLKRYASEDVGS